MLRLYHSPLACSLASRIALADSGLGHEIVYVHALKGEQNSESYRLINPRGKVPALETDEGVVTESGAILPLIADLAPEAKLFPTSGVARAQAQAWLAFFSGTLHPALGGAMFPERFTGCEASAIRAYNVAAAADALALIDAHLADKDYVLGGYSVCDAHLIVFNLWRRGPALAGALPDFANLDAFASRMMARPNVAQAVGDDMSRLAT